MIDVHNKRLVFQHCLKDLGKAFLPGIVSFLIPKGFFAVFHTCPLHQIIDILEMIVKCHAADPAVLCQICDGNLIKRFLFQKLFQ